MTVSVSLPVGDVGAAGVNNRDRGRLRVWLSARLPSAVGADGQYRARIAAECPGCRCRRRSQRNRIAILQAAISGRRRSTATPTFITALASVSLQRQLPTVCGHALVDRDCAAGARDTLGSGFVVEDLNNCGRTCRPFCPAGVCSDGVLERQRDGGIPEIRHVAARGEPQVRRRPADRLAMPFSMVTSPRPGSRSHQRLRLRPDAQGMAPLRPPSEHSVERRPTAAGSNASGQYSDRPPAWESSLALR